MNELALFAGAGGGILASQLIGWRTACAVERDAYAAAILAQRQNDGLLPAFPIWPDVRSFDGKPWAGIIDSISGGFPCQDISVAGKGAGIDGERSGLWREMARIIGEVRPFRVRVENSPMLIRRGLARVLSDLASMGYDAKWGIIGADDAGAPHRRKRIWIEAYLADPGLPEPQGRNKSSEGFEHCGRRAPRSEPSSCGNLADADLFAGRLSEQQRQKGAETVGRREMEYTDGQRCEEFNTACKPGEPRFDRGRINTWWGKDPADESESKLGRVAHGVAHRVDRLKAIGNGQVPAVAALAWSMLK